MSGPFSEQGKSAVSREPFAEWCEEQGLDFSLKAAIDSEELTRQKLWNAALQATLSSDTNTAQTAPADLRAAENAKD